MSEGGLPACLVRLFIGGGKDGLGGGGNNGGANLTVREDTHAHARAPARRSVLRRGVEKGGCRYRVGDEKEECEWGKWREVEKCVQRQWSVYVEWLE